MTRDPLFDETARIVNFQPPGNRELHFYDLNQVQSLQDLQRENALLEKLTRPILQKASKKQRFLTTVLDYSLDENSLMTKTAGQIESLGQLISTLNSLLSRRKREPEKLGQIDRQFRTILSDIQKSEQFLKQDQMTLQMELQELNGLFLQLDRNLLQTEEQKNQIASLLASQKGLTLSETASFFWTRLFEQYEQSLMDLKQAKLALAQQQAFLIETKQSHQLLQLQLERIQAISIAALIQALAKQGYENQMDTLFQAVSSFIERNPLLEAKSRSVLQEPGESLAKMKEFLDRIKR